MDAMAAPDISPPSFEKLHEHNYPDWKGNMCAFLRMKGVWRIVNGDEAAPTDADKLEKFTLRQEIAAGAIFLACDAKQQSHIKDEVDPTKMWNKLEQVHVRKNSSTRFVAYNALFNVRKKDDETDVAEFV